MNLHLARSLLITTAVLTFTGWPGSGLAFAGTASPIYVHMNGLNDFLPKVAFVEPGQPVVFVNQDQGSHTIVAYKPVGGEYLKKEMNEPVLKGTPGPGHAVHTYRVVFHHTGVHYYLCTIHAHLVSVYKTPGGQSYDLPAKREGTHGYRGSMDGTIVVTREKQLLASNPPITRQKILKKFWNNGDVTGN